MFMVISRGIMETCAPGLTGWNFVFSFSLYRKNNKYYDSILINHNINYLRYFLENPISKSTYHGIKAGLSLSKHSFKMKN